MTRRVGIDLVSADAVRASIDAHGERYLRRVFTAAERADCCCGTDPDPVRLAARVAAKEATFKTLRVDDRPVAWTDVETRHDETGRLELSLTGCAATLALQEGIFDLSLALTQERRVAAAVVIAEIR